MAQVTVDFDDYQSGSLPGVCVLTGAATVDRMVVRTAVRDPLTGSKPAGRLLRSLDGVFSTMDPRRPQHMLLGRLPIDPKALRRRLLERGVWQVTRWSGLVFLVLAAWASGPWSPVVAVASIAAIVVAGFRGWELKQSQPIPTLIGGGSQVHLQNVHEDFVIAVENSRKRRSSSAEG